MLHEALMLEIYRQALSAGALPTARPRSTESANSSERCPSHESNSSENGRDSAAAALNAGLVAGSGTLGIAGAGHLQLPPHSPNSAFPGVLPAQAAPSMEAYLHMVAAAAQQYGFPMAGGAANTAAAAAAAAASARLPVGVGEFKLPAQMSPSGGAISSGGGGCGGGGGNSSAEALDFRTNLFARAAAIGVAVAAADNNNDHHNEDGEDDGEDDADDEDVSMDTNNPLDLSVGSRKRLADTTATDRCGSGMRSEGGGSGGTDDRERDSSVSACHTIGQIQVKKIFKSDSPPAPPPSATAAAAHLQPPSAMMSTVNPYLAAVAAANIFRAGQFPDWNGKSDLVIDPLEKMSDIVKGPRKEKSRGGAGSGNNSAPAVISSPPSGVGVQSGSNQPVAAPPELPAGGTGTSTTGGGMTKARHNIWQSHWQNKGVASSVFRCVWCKQSFSTLEALTTHMKDSKHCGVNVPPFGNLPSSGGGGGGGGPHHHAPPLPMGSGGPPSSMQHGPGGGGGGGGGAAQHHSHNLRKQGGHHQQASSSPSSAAKAAFQYRSSVSGDPPTPLPRKLVRGQNVWLGKGVEQAMQILKCMRCGESFRSLGEMTKHMQETQHYTNILSQEQNISMKSNSAGTGGSGGPGGGSGGDAKEGHNSLSSEESRTLSAVMTCKVCDKAFNSLGDLSNHMAKNNHYAEPLMQSMAGGGNTRKRPAPKKREKSLPVRKLLEMKGNSSISTASATAGDASDCLEAKMQRSFENATKRMSLDMVGSGGGNEKSEVSMFAERMRQYITGIKPGGEDNNNMLGLLGKGKSPELETKNGTVNNKGSGVGGGASSVLSAIEHMFTTSFDTPARQAAASMPATSPSNSSSNKNTSPVASSILRRLGIDENCDYNKPLMDTSDPYYQHYTTRYTSSERSGSECSAEIHVEAQQKLQKTPSAAAIMLEKVNVNVGDKLRSSVGPTDKEAVNGGGTYNDSEDNNPDTGSVETPNIKKEIKSEIWEDEDEEPLHQHQSKSKSNNNDDDKVVVVAPSTVSGSMGVPMGVPPASVSASISASTKPTNVSQIKAKSRSTTPSGATSLAPAGTMHSPHSPTDSHRSTGTPKSPASSIKSYTNDDDLKKYPSDSLNALSSMFDSLGNGSGGGGGGGGNSANNQITTRSQATILPASNTTTSTSNNLINDATDGGLNLSGTSNSLAALRQFCVKKEKTS